MAEVRNDSRFGGQYMVQDRDHMSEINQAPDKAKRGVRQSEQAQDGGGQQGGRDQSATGQQGDRQRQSY
jgi:hypothetical protein